MNVNFLSLQRQTVYANICHLYGVRISLLVRNSLIEGQPAGRPV